VLRLLAESPVRYARVLLLATPENASSTERLAEDARGFAPDVQVRVLSVRDPSDYEQLFGALGPVVEALPGGAVDVLLSAGTPQAQATWILLVKAELLRARMLKVVPAAFVPDPHPHPVVEVRLDFAGFPEIRALREEVGRLRAHVEAGRRRHGLVGESPPMQVLRARIDAVARSEVPVIVHGETGTGKELVAEAVHKASTRAKGPWVAENCGAFADGVLQSELFGHERGAFTGATGRRRGLFEIADGGTLFLDEVGEMPLPTQASLLRVLQDGTLRRVGAERPTRVDVRVIVATHRDLAQRVHEGTFREDLYYRLRGATLEVPALRHRVADLELLVDHFLAGRRLVPTAAAWDALRAWAWPGNVRELRAEVLRWTVFCADRVALGDLAPEIREGGELRRSAPLAGHTAAEAPKLSSEVGDAAPSAPSHATLVRPLADVLAEAETTAIATAMSAHAGNLSRAARALGIDRNTLKRKLKAGLGG
jgi:DNA-binding NtrC family response regulator